VLEPQRTDLPCSFQKTTQIIDLAPFPMNMGNENGRSNTDDVSSSLAKGVL
jgi:hypothetical protein